MTFSLVPGDMSAASAAVTGASSDLHSGRFGGTVANPVHALSALLAGLHTPDGRVAVDGFYDGVAELLPPRRAEIAAVRLMPA